MKKDIPIVSNKRLLAEFLTTNWSFRKLAIVFPLTLFHNIEHELMGISPNTLQKKAPKKFVLSYFIKKYVAYNSYLHTNCSYDHSPQLLFIFPESALTVVRCLFFPTCISLSTVTHKDILSSTEEKKKSLLFSTTLTHCSPVSFVLYSATLFFFFKDFFFKLTCIYLPSFHFFLHKLIFWVKNQGTSGFIITCKILPGK